MGSGSSFARQEEFAGVGEGGVVYFAGEHAGQFAATFFALDSLDTGERAAVGGGFGNDHMGFSFRGYLGEVGDGQDLVSLAKLPELRPDRRRRLAAYPGVDFVEDVRRARLDAFLGEADGEHDATELSARGVASHWQLRFARIRLDHELHPLLAVRPQSAFGKFRPEGRPPEVQIAQVRLHFFRELLRRPTTTRRECVPKLLELR